MDKLFKNEKFIWLIMFVLSGVSALGQTSLSEFFTNNMVFQQGKPINLWGTSIPGKTITVQFSSEVKKTRVKTDSSWQVTFPPQVANSKPQKMQVLLDDQEIILNNILVGDVWVLSGQSNMEWPLKSEMHFNDENRQIDPHNLRFYNANYEGKGIFGEKYSSKILKNLTPEKFYSGTWKTTDSDQLKELSAVGYYFGQSILKHVDIPIGLINIAIGGAPIETFISVKTLRKHPDFRKKVKGNWLYNDALPVWVRKRGIQNVEDVAIRKDKLGPNHAYKPGFAYLSGIKELQRFPVKGILWYQGESNAQEKSRVEEYLELQKLMINDYRKKWNQPEMPFYWVQLSSIDTINYNSHLWPEFRNEQRRLINEMKNVGMAVTSDIGAQNDVHPRNKKDVGIRLARWALSEVYGKDILVSGPLPVKAKYKKGKLIIRFKYIGNGLKTRNDKTLRGFSIDGKTLLTAEIGGDRVEVLVSEKPEFIFYGWQPFSLGNLMNSENLPASSFKLKVN